VPPAGNNEGQTDLVKLSANPAVSAVVLSAVLAACGGVEEQTQQPLPSTVQTTAQTNVQSTVPSTVQVTAQATVTATSIGRATGQSGGDRFPDVIGVKLTTTSDRVYDVDATLSSPYDTPERYADAFRVITQDGKVLGIRELTHDHQTEQPFTRSLGEVGIQAGIDVVIVEGRDQMNGWGGQRWEIAVP
jgi:hypothetical protein